MKTSFQILASTLVLASGFAFAQGEPSTMTPSTTATTEAPAAAPAAGTLKEAMKACKALPKADRKACVKKAHEDFPKKHK